MRCPVCQADMKQETMECVVVDVCEQHGIWLDKKELFEITERRRRNDPSPRWMTLFKRMQRPGGHTHRTLSCPVTHKPMKIVRYHDVQIDWSEGHGVWLDNGELEAIMSNLQLDPDYMGGISLRLSDQKF